MESLIKSLRDHGIHISVEADNLKVNFDGAQIPSDLLAQLKEHKMELMAHLRAIGAGSEYVPIPKIDDESNRYLLSSAQKRLWIASQIPSASVSYNMPFSAELPEAYSDLAILRESVAHVVDRHESLRTVFKMDKEGEVYQTILSSESIPQEIDFVDLSDSENAEQELSDYIKTDAIKPFDLECGPLFRMSCFKVSASRYHLYYNLHHIITDEWSMEVLRGDIFATYEMIKAGKTPQLSPLKIQYKDYASWQLKSLESEAMDASATYWKQVLEGEIVPQGLPSHRSRPSRKTNNGKRIRTFLGTEVTNSLKRLTQEQGGSLFMLLLSSFKVLLSHYSGQRDIWIGSPVAGRDHADLENQIGFYLNTLVLRNFVDHDATFAEFYETVKKNVLDAFSHQMYPFDRLLEDLNVSRDLSRNPLFDLLLDYHKSVDIEIDEGLTGRINDLGEKPAKFDIEIHFTELPEHLGITVDYNTDVYQDDIIFQFVDQFTHFLSNLEGCFENRISELQLVTEKERKKILERSKGVPMVEAEDETVLGMFSKTAVDYPTRQVVSLFDEHLDYETLDRWSTCLAQKLVGELNMSPGTHIGIKMDHSPLLMVAILGVLKAGCAFVPIDPSYTSEREQYIIDDAAIGLLITTTAFIFDYSEADFALLSIDVEFDAISVDQGIQLPEVDGATLAYVIYTSGSTGTPKGVMIEHASLNNYLNWAKETYLGNALSNNDFGLFTSISFDLTITSMFLPLITGGTLKMQGNDRDVVQVLNDYANSEISCIKLTPAHIGVLASLEMEQTTIELAIVGGDVLTGQQVIELQRLNPNIKIYNEYGPTEATVGCIVKEVINPRAITIGTPIANMEAYVLNSELKPVPNHVIGELYLGGRGLS
ncbi:MAG: condensation domain-containing protein, partial [Bacteroidota bacterium]